MARKDAHAPASKEFDPQAYICLGVFDGHEHWGNHAARREMVSRLVDRGYKFGPGSSDRCGHCGSRMRYAALMAREDMKEFIFVGEQCLGGRFEMTKAEFDSLRKAAKLNKERATKAEIAARMLEENEWLREFNASDISDSFLSDLAIHAHNGRVLTERQIEAGAKAWVKAQERDAQRKVEAENAVPAPEGKVTVVGEVKTVKWQESIYGGQLKMLVLADEGFKVWSTVPTSLQGVTGLVSGNEWKFTQDVQVGERVEFTATLTPSDNDNTFAIAKRPTKARILSRA